MVRLVKGAYAEPEAIAYQGHREVDANFAALAVELLEARKAGRHPRIGLGTHDVRLVEQIEGHARALGLARGASDQCTVDIGLSKQRSGVVRFDAASIQQRHGIGARRGCPQL